MKVLALTFFSAAVFFQATAQPSKRKIYVSFNERTIVIFPGEITDDVCGNEEQISVEKKINKYYLIANSRQGFVATNLYIELASGHYYDIILEYTTEKIHNPSIVTPEEATGNLEAVTNATALNQPVTSPTNGNSSQPTTINMNADQKAMEPMTKSLIDPTNPLSVANYVSEKPQNVYECEAFERGMYFSLQSLFIYNNRYYMKLVVENKSNVEYEIQSIEFLVKAKGKLLSKTPGDEGQPMQIEPVAIYNKDINKIKGKARIIKVYVYDKFTLSEKNKLAIKLFEVNGAREIGFDIESNRLQKAKNLVL